jgi:hypothetical protein
MTFSANVFMANAVLQCINKKETRPNIRGGFLSVQNQQLLNITPIVSTADCTIRRGVIYLV